jgi:hypothetical protein
MPLSDLLSLISTAAVVGGVIFAGVQLRVAMRQRARDAELLANIEFREPG